MKYLFEVSSTGPIRLRITDDHGHLVRDVPAIIQMGQACKLLRRSRRHMYRYIQRGWLRPLVTFSGEHFFDPRDLDRLEKPPGRGRRSALPAKFAPLFPEYRIKGLELERDADVILSRILERGDSREIRWVLKRYPLARVRLFLKTQGRRLLSARTFHFWTWLWGGVRHAHRPFWRRRGLLWGGAA